MHLSLGLILSLFSLNDMEMMLCGSPASLTRKVELVWFSTGVNVKRNKEEMSAPKAVVTLPKKLLLLPWGCKLLAPFIFTALAIQSVYFWALLSMKIRINSGTLFSIFNVKKNRNLGKELAGVMMYSTSVKWVYYRKKCSKNIKRVVYGCKAVYETGCII